MKMKNITISADERVLWQGKPNKSLFIFKSFVNFLLPIAIVWCAFDFLILNVTLFDESDNETKWFLIPFLLLHMAPVWIYLGNALFSLKRYSNTEYAITDKAIYISGGVISVNTEMKPLALITNLSVKRSYLERKFGLGSVNIGDGTAVGNYNGRGINVDPNLNQTIAGIKDYEKVFNLIKKQQNAAGRDLMYPNALRPDNND